MVAFRNNSCVLPCESLLLTCISTNKFVWRFHTYYFIIRKQKRMSKSKGLQKPEDNKRYSELSTARTTWGIVFRFPSPSCPYLLWGPPSHLSIWYRDVFPRGLQSWSLTPSIDQVHMLNYTSSSPPLPHPFKAWLGSMSFLSISQIKNQFKSHNATHTSFPIIDNFKFQLHDYRQRR